MYNGKITYEVTILYEISKEKTSEKILSLLKELNILNMQRQFHYNTDETNKDKIKSEINDCINKNLFLYIKHQMVFVTSLKKLFLLKLLLKYTL